MLGWARRWLGNKSGSAARGVVTVGRATGFCVSAGCSWARSASSYLGFGLEQGLGHGGGKGVVDQRSKGRDVHQLLMRVLGVASGAAQERVHAEQRSGLL